METKKWSISTPSRGSGERAHRKNNIRDEGAEEASPHRLDRPVDRHFLVRAKSDWVRLHIVYERGALLTSSENKTPPIGLPNATATPVADAAVTISLILAAGRE